MTNQEFQAQFPLLMEFVKHAYDAQAEIKYARPYGFGIEVRLEIKGSLHEDNEYYGVSARYSDGRYNDGIGVTGIDILRHANTASCSDARWAFRYEPVGVIKIAEQPYERRLLSYTSFGMNPEEAYADFVKHYNRLKKLFDKQCQDMRAEIADANAARIAELQNEIDRLSVSESVVEQDAN